MLALLFCWNVLIAKTTKSFVVPKRQTFIVALSNAQFDISNSAVKFVCGRIVRSVCLIKVSSNDHCTNDLAIKDPGFSFLCSYS